MNTFHFFFFFFLLLILYVDVADARFLVNGFSVPPRNPRRGVMGGRIGMEIRNPVSGPDAGKNHG